MDSMTSSGIQIVCPIRGYLNVSKRTADGLTPTEEYYRIESIKYLLSKGYPKDHFWVEPIVKRFGSNGRNSFRSDAAILDVPVRTIDTRNADVLMDHVLLISEIKRDNQNYDYVKRTQIKPMLDFARNSNTIGLYWDNIDKRVFWTEMNGGIKEYREGPLTFIPQYGHKIETTPLTFSTIYSAESLVDAFGRVENVLHQASFSPEKRYEIIMQLLIMKIFDEHAHESFPDKPLDLQDYHSLGTPEETVKEKVSDTLRKAVSYYERHLPNKVSHEMPLSGEALYEVLRILAPIKITQSKRDVVQTFYMKFAKDMYKWDMAQYFTPTAVTDFIVDIINPQFGEHVADPACGSADFLVAAFRNGRNQSPGYADCIWGIDNSTNAIQVAILNMVLNGDGKTNIKKDDSLENIDNYIDRFDVVICNPPFGTKIVEKRRNVLRKFDLGFEWMSTQNGNATKTDELLRQQETGILFLEACIRICRSKGRIAIILPNGYLGNRSTKYRVAREWLLKNARIAAIVSLPRFTFKSSGADVSASVVYLEKRDVPLQSLTDDYCFAVEMVEKLGWDAGNKKGSPVYKRNQDDGSIIINEDGEPVIDCDFNQIIERVTSSNAAACFDWLSAGRAKENVQPGWSVSIEKVYEDSDYTLDPKRYSMKIVKLKEAIMRRDHLLLGELVEFIPERTSSLGERTTANRADEYRYVELQDIGYGDYYSHDMRGWELPGRAKHFAEAGDIYVGSIWGSCAKWCYIPSGSTNVVVTNGCLRLRMQKGKERYITDLIAYINSEGWSAQMRAFARGSDGLAEICADDAKQIVIPLLTMSAREKMQKYIADLKEGRSTVHSTIKDMIRNGEIEYCEPEKRPSHMVLV